MNSLPLSRPCLRPIPRSLPGCAAMPRIIKGVFQPGVIVFTYERPTLLHEEQIRRVFPEVPFTSSYGATEVGYVFMQCEAGRLHQNSQYCRVDFQSLRPEHGGPLLGRILVTTFRNPWFYILRFNVGDLVRLEESGHCPCGRETGLILAGVEGRVADATLTTGGRLVTVGELDRVMSSMRNLDEYRLEQITAATTNCVSSRRLTRASSARG